MNALKHAGCGGPIVKNGDTLQCKTCHRQIVDPRELAPRGGWEQPEAAIQPPVPLVGVTLL
jgi:hypothetical protein